MKHILRTVHVLLFMAIALSALAQENGSTRNYYGSIKKYDLSHLWRGTSMQTDEGIKKDFPEPLGYIGNNFQRFYIHYISVKKDPLDPYRYLVTGKTRVKNKIYNFKGAIVVKKARRFIPSYTGFTQGEVECVVDFKEDSLTYGGTIKGKLITQFCINGKGRLLYDALDLNADGYYNNQCKAIWTSYKTNLLKKCCWGDYRIPASQGFDVGAGEFMPYEKYAKNGWESYLNTSSPDSIVSKKAQTEENRNWWE